MTGYLIHRYLNSNAERKSHRVEIEETIITETWEYVVKPAIGTGLLWPVGPSHGVGMDGPINYDPPKEFRGWYVHLQVDNSKLKGRLWGSQPPKPPKGIALLDTAAILFEVFVRGRVPYCEVLLMQGFLALTPDQWIPSGALERCIAWAWLDKRHTDTGVWKVD